MNNTSDKIQTPELFLREFFRLNNNGLLYLDLSCIAGIALFVSFNQYLSEFVSNVLFIVLIAVVLYLLVRIGIFLGGLLLSFQGKRIGEIQKQSQHRRSPLSQNATADQKINASLSWFTAIAVLSVINALLIVFKANVQFMIGLGAVQWIGYISQVLAAKFGAVYLFVGLLFNLSIAWFFYYVRKNASSNEKYIYVGLVVYTLDALLFIPITGYLEIGFHIFVIIMISQYFRFNRLKHTKNPKSASRVTSSIPYSQVNKQQYPE